MSKKTNKIKPSKALKTPTSNGGASSTSAPGQRQWLRVEFFQANNDEWNWRAMRSGSVVAFGGKSYIKKDKMKRTLLNLAESLGKKQWVLKEQEG